MEDQNVAIRLKGFIESEGLSHSQFADRCGIPRPSLSQILSGRNKKISDVIIGQIHKAYPELSILWLLFGEGSMRSGAAGDKCGCAAQKSSGMAGDAEEDSEGAVGESFSVDDLDSSLADGVSGILGSGGEGNSWGGSPLQAQYGVKNGYESPENSGNRSGAPEFSNVNALKVHVETIQRLEKQLKERDLKIESLQMQIEKMTKNPRKVSHITVYYDDSTFETFTPQS